MNRKGYIRGYTQQKVAVGPADLATVKRQAPGIHTESGIESRIHYLDNGRVVEPGPEHNNSITQLHKTAAVVALLKKIGER
jgi:hypothetical protein